MDISGSNSRKYLNRIFVWIIHLSCVCQSWDHLLTFALNSGKYLNRIFVWITHLSCVCQSWDHLLTFALNSGKYLNRIFVWIIHLSCVRRLCNELQIFSSNSTKYFNGILVELFICLVFIDHVINFKSLVWIQPNIWIESSYNYSFVRRSLIM
jgi:hypothetical protein